MKKTNTIGALSSIGLAIIYVVGALITFTLLDTTGITDSIKLVEFMKDHAGPMQVSITFMYVVFGFLLIVLSLVLNEKLKTVNEYWAKMATTIGLIWAGLLIASGMVHNVGMNMAIDLYSINPEEAGRFFRLITAIHIGLGGGNEIPGAMWTLLISLIGMKYRIYGMWIHVLGVIAGVAGLLTIIPALFDQTVMVFALGQVIWWIWLSVKMFKDKN
jgi:hypothetical protein